jgi:hypothetical protein
MKIELLHSITHDGREYLPGLHELPDALAAQFLKYDWAAQPYLPPTATAGQVRLVTAEKSATPEAKEAAAPAAEAKAKKK